MIKKFHIEQAESFRDYASKFAIKHGGDLIFLFKIWTEAKDFSGKDKLIIWKLVKDWMPQS